MANSKAVYAVNKAVKRGELPHIRTQVCVDCGDPAKHYDHRDYDKPLDVEPVCIRCNFARGMAVGTHDFKYVFGVNVTATVIQSVKIKIEKKARKDGVSVSYLLRELLTKVFGDNLDDMKNEVFNSRIDGVK